MCCVCLGYFYDRFLLVQRAVDFSIMLELAGGSVLQDINVLLKSFPHPPYNEDPFIQILQLQMPFLIIVSFIVTAAIICKDVVLEKEKKLKVNASCLVLLL